MDYHSLLASAGMGSALGITAFFLFIVLAVLALVILLLVANWRIYQKAGRPGWASIVPFYNTVVMLEFTSRPLWWVILLFIPIANIIFGILMVRRLAGVFGKGVGFTVGLVLLPFIFIPILGFGKSQYSNTYPSPAPLSEAGKWALIALFAYLLMQSAFSVRVNALIDMFDEISSGLSDSDSYLMDDTSVYTVDDLYVYYLDEIIPGAEPETFYDLGMGYGVDDNSVYYYGEVVDGADAATFTVLEYPSEWHDAEDVNAWYYAGYPLSEEEREEATDTETL